MKTPISLFLLSILQFLQFQSKLISVIELFRHGARGIIYNYYDYKDQDQQDLYGQLTSGGQRQHFELGRALRKEYIENQQFLSPQFNHSEFKAFSTDVNRTIQSAQSQLFGLYPLGTGPQLLDVNQQYTYPPFKDVYQYELEENEALPKYFEPVPVHTVRKEDLFLSNECPNQFYFFKDNRIQNQELYDQVQERFKPLMEKYSKFLTEYHQYPVNLTTTHDLYQIYDNFMSNKYQERQLPDILTEEDYIQLQMAASFEWAITYGSGEYNKIGTTEFFRYIINEFEMKIQDGDQYTNKFTMLSGHDDNIVKTLAALNLLDPECILKKYDNQLDQDLNCQDIPVYASQLIFELHQNDNDSENYQVKLKYQGEQVEVCQGVMDCDFDIFKKEREQYMVDNPYKLCGFMEIQQEGDKEQMEAQEIYNASVNHIFIFILILFVILCLTFTAMIFMKYKQVKQLRIEYHEQSQNFD